MVFIEEGGMNQFMSLVCPFCGHTTRWPKVHDGLPAAHIHYDSNTGANVVCEWVKVMLTGTYPGPLVVGD